MGDASAEIIGTVLYEGNPLPGVSITIDAPHFEPRYLTTDANGNYALGGIPASTYSVGFLLQGLSPVTSSITVAAGETARVDAVLTLDPLFGTR